MSPFRLLKLETWTIYTKPEVFIFMVRILGSFIGRAIICVVG